MLEDREGDLWVGTNLGLDRFRAADVARLSAVPVTSRAGYVGGVDARGRVVIKDVRALYRVAPDLQTTILARQRSAPLAVCAVRGATWVATVDDFLRVTDDAVAHVAGPPGWRAGSAGCAAEASGGLVALLSNGRLYRWDGAWRPMTPPSPPPAGQLRWATVDPKGGLWLCYGGGLVHLAGGRLERYEGLGEVRLGRLDALIDDGRDILIGGERGLGRLRGRVLQVIGPDQVQGLERVTGLARTPDGDLWASGIDGVARISAPELDRAFQDLTYRPRLQWLDSRDGLPGRAQQDTYQNTAFSAGGRVWFMTNHGVAWAEPRRFVRNPLPPPVVIRALSAGDRSAAFPNQVTLPTGARSVEIDYAAMSLSIPERVRFRYRLDGVDAGWVDPGARRQASYTKLSPGSYVFRVVAANDSPHRRARQRPGSATRGSRGRPGVGSGRRGRGRGRRLRRGLQSGGEGERRPLHPLVAEECRRVGEEALTNAFRHAQA